jgi:hypothetical protein
LGKYFPEPETGFGWTRNPFANMGCTEEINVKLPSTEVDVL